MIAINNATVDNGDRWVQTSAVKNNFSTLIPFFFFMNDNVTSSYVIKWNLSISFFLQFKSHIYFRHFHLMIIFSSYWIINHRLTQGFFYCSIEEM